MAMRAAFPSQREATALPVDRLGLHVLWFLEDRGTYEDRVQFIYARLREYDEREGGQGRVYEQTPALLGQPVARAWVEAWEWCIARGLVTADLQKGTDRWAISRLGQRIAAEREPLTHLRSLALLETELHPRIAETARSLFVQGHYELAAFEAMKQVEIRVREMSGAGEGDIGVGLMREAFKPHKDKDGSIGPLTDPAQEKGEQEATSALYAGAIGVIKNPTSHRQVEYDDPTEASEAVLLADLLLRILDRRAKALGKHP